jgi:hypothetical protein
MKTAQQISRRKFKENTSENTIDKEVFMAWKASPNLTQEQLGNHFSLCKSRVNRILTRCIKKYGLEN